MRRRRPGRLPAAPGGLILAGPGLALVATTCVDPTAVEPWRIALHELVTDLGGSLWRLLDPPPDPSGSTSPAPGSQPGHSHVAWLEGDDPVGAYRAAVAGACDTGRLPRGHADVGIELWVAHGDRYVVSPGAAAEGLIVAEVLCTDPGRVAEWDAWYDATHLPDMLATGAFSAGRRWRRAAPSRGGADHLTVYEIAGITVPEAVTRSAAALPGLVAAGRKHECHTGGATLFLVRETA